MNKITIWGCEEENKDETLPKYEAKGYVLGMTGLCEGNGVYIEVATPKGIGKKGVFKFGVRENEQKYKNAIRVPHFDKVNLPVELMQEGFFLHFQYRKYNPDKDRDYFSGNELCLWDNIPPTANTYIVTKIISHKSKE